MRISNRTFIVSGGSNGLGLATVLELLQFGANVAILDRSSPPTFLPTKSTKFFQCDIADTKTIEQAVEDTVSWAAKSDAPLGGVVNCAGIGKNGRPIVSRGGEPHPLEEWSQMLAVNLTGSFNLTRLALKHLIQVEPEGKDAERGVVVLVSSSAADEAPGGMVAYAASKGAVLSMTLPLARDLARHGVRVVTIVPSSFQTNMAMAIGKSLPEQVQKTFEDKMLLFPRRLGDPSEFAKTVRWIFECTYVNGEAIRLSGGQRIPAKL
ncbi:NAD(P)-binding protein [Mycena kentingensis (nom. inval.)]|nr:NAD(P)-binding protein [Mycena kentingensis (nom. inval.)]